MSKNQYFDEYLSNEINNLIYTRQYEKAKIKLEQYKEKFPNDQMIIIFESKILINERKYHEAEMILKSFLDSNIKRAFAKESAILQLADSLRFQNKYDEALSYYKKCLKFNNSTTIYAVIKMTNILVDKEKYDEALNIIDSTTIESPKLKSKKAYINIKKGDYYKAIEILEELEDSLISNDEIQYKHYLLAKIYYDLFEMDKALNSIQKCFNIKTKYYWKSKILYGEIKSRLNKDEEGILICEETEKLYPTQEGKEALIRMYIKSGMHEAAKNQIEKLFCFNQNHNQRNYYLGKIALSNSNYIEAEKYFEEIINGNGRSNKVSAKYHLIVTKYRLKKYDEVKELISTYTNNYIEERQKNRRQEDIRKILNIINGVDTTYNYSDQQQACYDESLAITHIIENHYNKGQFNPNIFKSPKDIEVLFNEIKNKLNKSKRMIRGYCDSYIFYYENIGYNNNIKTDVLEVICFPDTYNIVTMFPTSKYKGLMEQKVTIKETKTKKLSQIDKFYKRYGKQ